jgi:hypothetical protein
MKLTSRDLRQLGLPLVVLGLIVVSMLGLVAFSYHQKTQSEVLLSQQQAELNQALQRYQSSGQEKETIVKYLPTYQRLISEGFIGEERRIEWVDNLRVIHQDNKLFGIDYNIATQEAYQPAFNVNLGNLTMYRSVMKLELAMLHEGDLLLLMEELSARKITPFILRQCEMMKRSNATFDKFSPNMQAKCELDWLTVREPEVFGSLP